MRNTKSLVATVLAIVCLTFAISPDGKKETVAFSIQGADRPMRVLFLGNSYTYLNDLPRMLSRIAASAEPPLAIKTAQYAPGGYTLERHWRDKRALPKISKKRWDFVVLQEQSLRPVLDPKKMYEFARKFDAEIKKAGARTVFYMAWARQRKPEMIERLARAYNRISAQLNAKVAPVGRAWQRSLEKRPDLMLHGADRSHPNPYGTYLAACVIYATLTGRTPAGLSGLGFHDEDAKFLQQMAWETVMARKP